MHSLVAPRLCLLKKKSVFFLLSLLMSNLSVSPPPFELFAAVAPSAKQRDDPAACSLP